MSDVLAAAMRDVEVRLAKIECRLLQIDRRNYSATHADAAEPDPAGSSVTTTLTIRQVATVLAILNSGSLAAGQLGRFDETVAVYEKAISEA